MAQNESISYIICNSSTSLVCEIVIGYLAEIGQEKTTKNETYFLHLLLYFDMREVEYSPCRGRTLIGNTIENPARLA